MGGKIVSCAHISPAAAVRHCWPLFAFLWLFNDFSLFSESQSRGKRWKEIARARECESESEVRQVKLARSL